MFWIAERECNKVEMKNRAIFIELHMCNFHGKNLSWVRAFGMPSLSKDGVQIFQVQILNTINSNIKIGVSANNASRDSM